MKKILYIYALSIPFQRYGIALENSLIFNPLTILPFFYLFFNPTIRKKNIILYSFFIISLLIPGINFSRQFFMLCFLSFPFFIININKNLNLFI